MIPSERAIFTTFRSDTSDLTAHWQRLCNQSQSYFDQPVQLTLEQLYQCREQFSEMTCVLKLIVTITQQWYLAIRPLPTRKSHLHLESIYDIQRNEQARIKDAQRSYYLEQLESSRIRGYDDALYVNHQGIVLETTIASLFWSDGTKLYTPAAALPILQGTFATQVGEWCQMWGVELEEAKWTIEQIKKQAVQIWCCNAVSGWQTIQQLDEDWTSRPSAWTQALSEKITQQEW